MCMLGIQEALITYELQRFSGIKKALAQNINEVRSLQIIAYNTNYSQGNQGSNNAVPSIFKSMSCILVNPFY